MQRKGNDMMELNRIYNMDCLEGMKQIEDKSIDLILTDPPYGITDNEWDIELPWNDLWTEFDRLIKEKGSIIIFSKQPFTTDLINSNRKQFKYELIWDKVIPTGFVTAKYQPLKQHENILIFYDSFGIYNPIPFKKNTKGYFNSNNSMKIHNNWKNLKQQKANKDNENIEGFPRSILKEHRPYNLSKTEEPKHPTQKPIQLIKYLTSMYSNPNNLILDPFMGSGTTAVACKQLGRNFIGFEINPEYCKIAEERLKQKILRDVLE